MLITTNYMIEGQGGSHEDRIFEVEFSDHYNQHHRPSDEFGGLFFEGWDEEEWLRFDNAMMQTVQTFIAVGLKSYDHINLKERKLRQLTDNDFAEWILVDPPELSVDHPKGDLYDSFIADYPEHRYNEETKQGTAQSRLTRWLKAWAKLEGYRITEARIGEKRIRCIRFEEHQNA